MLQITVAVHLPDGCIKKFLADRFLCGLVKVHGFWVRAVQVGQGVLHIVLYLVVVLVHCLVILLIFCSSYIVLYDLFKFRDSCSLISKALAEAFHILEEVLVSAAASKVPS